MFICGIPRNMYLILSLDPNSASETLGISWVTGIKGASFVTHNRPLSNTSEFMHYVTSDESHIQSFKEVEGPQIKVRTNCQWFNQLSRYNGTSIRKTLNKSCCFSFLVLFAFVMPRMEPSACWTSAQSLSYTPNLLDSFESLQVSEHIKMLEGWHTRGQKNSAPLLL